MSEKITDEEYELRNLQTSIQRTIIYLNKLQRRHNQLTGREFVISGPLPDKEKP
jgi:hypothetical protein